MLGVNFPVMNQAEGPGWLPSLKHLPSHISTNFLQDDPEWFWVQRPDGPEGFVPAGFIYPLDAIQKQRKLDTWTVVLIDFVTCSEHMNLPMTAMSLGSSTAPPPPPPLSSSGGGSGPSSLSPGSLGVTSYNSHSNNNNNSSTNHTGGQRQSACS